MRFNPINLSLFLSLFLLTMCKKTQDTKTPGLPDTNDEIKSMTVTYPFLYTAPYPYRSMKYRFSQDPVARSFTVHIDDSIQMRVDLYGIYHRTKTYYLSNLTPQTVNKVSVRMTGQLQEQDPQVQDNYDLLFEYSPGYYFPKLITTIVYDDTLGTAIHSKTQDSVTIYDPVNYHYVAGGLNVLDCTNTEPFRAPLLEWITYRYQLSWYTDRSYELINHATDLNNLLFNGYMDEYPKKIRSLYQYNQDTLLTSLILDACLVTTNIYITVTNQRKLDYHYSNTNPAITNLFNISGIAQAITAEEWTVPNTRINEKWGPDYASMDAYLTNTYSYYQNICDYYTDSLFQVNPDYSKTLISAETYTNTIYRSADNKITRITKTKSDGTILRNIELGY